MNEGDATNAIVSSDAPLMDKLVNDAGALVNIHWTWWSHHYRDHHHQWLLRRSQRLCGCVANVRHLVQLDSSLMDNGTTQWSDAIISIIERNSGTLETVRIACDTVKAHVIALFTTLRHHNHGHHIQRVSWANYRCGWGTVATCHSYVTLYIGIMSWYSEIELPWWNRSNTNRRVSWFTCHNDAIDNVQR